MKHFYPNISICNDGCEYNSVDYKNHRFICDCYIDEKNSKNTDGENGKKEESYLDYFLSLINYKIIICYKLFFEFSNFYYNTGFYISFSILFIFLIMMLIFWIKGMKKLRLIFYENIPTNVDLIKDLKKNPDTDDNNPQIFRKIENSRNTKLIGPSESISNQNSNKGLKEINSNPTKKKK